MCTPKPLSQLRSYFTTYLESFAATLAVPPSICYEGIGGFNDVVPELDNRI